MSVDQEIIRRDQAMMLYRLGTRVVFYNSINACILALLLQGKLPTSLLIPWTCMIVGVASFRHFLIRRVLNNPPNVSEAEQYIKRFTYGSTIMGLLWGLTFAFYAPHLEMIYQVFILLVLAGLSAGAHTSMSSVPQAFFGFFFGMFLPVIGWLSFQPDSIYITMMAMVLLFLLGLSTSFITINKMSTESISLQIEKTTLIQSLQKANEEVSQLTVIDELTGIPNRRKFNDILEKEWARAQRNQSEISLIMIDIDFFKSYNDYYGHLEGDTCLKRVAHTIHKMVRSNSDLVARYGGEEFAVILPETHQDSAIKKAQAIKDAVEHARIPHENSSVSSHVTVSLGVATKIPIEKNSNLLIEMADKALYTAKKNGRNRVHSSAEKI